MALWRTDAMESVAQLEVVMWSMWETRGSETEQRQWSWRGGEGFENSGEGWEGKSSSLTWPRGSRQREQEPRTHQDSQRGKEETRHREAKAEQGGRHRQVLVWNSSIPIHAVLVLWSFRAYAGFHRAREHGSPESCPSPDPPLPQVDSTHRR